MKKGVDLLLIPPEINPVSSGFSDPAPVGLLALVAGLKRHRFKAAIYHPRLRLLDIADYKSVATDILSYQPGIIGFSTWCTSYPASLLLSRQIRILNPGIPIVFGGPQASITAVETLENFNDVDYILAGEADFSIIKLVRFLSGKVNTSLYDIEGLFFRDKNGSIVQNSNPVPVLNLDELPVPDYSETRRSGAILLDAGRGCPFRCTFCTTNSFFSKNYRTKSVQRIIREMDVSSESTGISHFSFAHDMFTLNKIFIKTLCETLTGHYSSTGQKYLWTCSSRIDCITPELLELMKEAGCNTIFFGLESGSEKIQMVINKNLKISDGYKITDTCRNLNIRTYVSFMIGFPQETSGDIEKTLQSILEFAIRGALPQISELSLLPGTPLHSEYKDSLLYDGLFSNFSHSVPGRPETELIKKYPGIFSSFYYLPVRSVKRVPMVILCRLINIIPDFCNTIFLLKDLIRQDIKEINLLELYLSRFSEIRKLMDSDFPLASILIGYLKKYMKSKQKVIPEHFWDVFIWEANQSLLKARFLRWQLTGRYDSFIKGSNDVPAGHFISTPLWQIQTTSYEMHAILPSKNGWKTEKPETRKGKFHYLLTTISEKNCKFMRIRPQEFELLDVLRTRAPGGIAEIQRFPSGRKVPDKWLDKMISLRVISQEK